jgi:hypothetical protein
MPNLSVRVTAFLRRLVMGPLRPAARVIDRRADILLTKILRRELALHERELQHAPDPNTLPREVAQRQYIVDLVQTAIQGHELALHEREAERDMILDALLREVIRLQQLVEELLARHDQIEEESATVTTTIPIRERSA